MCKEIYRFWLEKEDLYYKITIFVLNMQSLEFSIELASPRLRNCMNSRKRNIAKTFPKMMSVVIGGNPYDETKKNRARRNELGAIL